MVTSYFCRDTQTQQRPVLWMLLALPQRGARIPPRWRCVRVCGGHLPATVHTCSGLPALFQVLFSYLTRFCCLWLAGRDIRLLPAWNQTQLCRIRWALCFALKLCWASWGWSCRFPAGAVHPDHSARKVSRLARPTHSILQTMQIQPHWLHLLPEQPSVTGDGRLPIILHWLRLCFQTSPTFIRCFLTSGGKTTFLVLCRS